MAPGTFAFALVPAWTTVLRSRDRQTMSSASGARTVLTSLSADSARANPAPTALSLRLKTDIETEGEVALAAKELRRLVADGVSFEGELDELTLGGRVTGVLRGDRARAARALDRLAYFDRGSLGGIELSPQQATLERLSATANGQEETNRRSREYLGHGIHKYKAKFFPRMCRSLINICCPTDGGVVLDPYCGSGTTLAEATLLGLSAVGTDIDPLSCMIATEKVRFPISGAASLRRLVAAASDANFGQPSLFSKRGGSNYTIPEFLRKKLDASVAEQVEVQVASLMRDLTEAVEPADLGVARLVASHVISTKISLRWVGTGDNRFALELGAIECSTVAKSHARRLLRSHPETMGWKPPPHLRAGIEDSRVIRASAGATGLAAESVDAVVTSPPYLPASSGRETYLRSRAPALVLLGLLDEGEILDLDADHVTGSVLRRPERSGALPVHPAVTDLVEWMRPQRARGPKADPTIAYFQDLLLAGRETHRVLKPGGMAAFVVATQHTFYELVTRQIVRSFPLAEVLAEMYTQNGYGVGFSKAELITLELPKADFKARPASRHAYSETVVLLTK